MPSTIYDEYFEQSTSTIESSLEQANRAILANDDVNRKTIQEILVRVKDVESRLRTSGADTPDLRQLIEQIYHETNTGNSSKLRNLLTELSSKLDSSGNQEDSKSLRKLASRTDSRTSERYNFSKVADILPSLPRKSLAELSVNTDELEEYQREVSRAVSELNDDEQKRHDELLRYYRRIFGDEKLLLGKASNDNSSGIFSSLLGGAAGASVSSFIPNVVTPVLSFLASGAGLAALVGISAAVFAATNWGEISKKVKGAFDSTADFMDQWSLESQLLDSKDSNLSKASPSRMIPLSPTQTKLNQALSSKYELSSDYVRSVIAAEGNNPAKNPLSSARGYGQITDPTIEGLVKKYPDKFKSGEVSTQRGDLDNDMKLIALLAEDNRKTLRAKLGREPTEEDLMGAHFLGAPDYAKLMQADRSTPIQSILSPDIVANHPFLGNTTVEEARKGISSRYSIKKAVADRDLSIMRDVDVSGNTLNINDVNDQRLIIDGLETRQSSKPSAPTSTSQSTPSSPQSSVQPKAATMSPAQVSSAGHSATSSPLFINDPGILLFLSGTA
jgi:hypothetical protein